MICPRLAHVPVNRSGTAPCSKGALAARRKKLAAFSAAAGRFLRFPIGDRRCNRTRASVGNAGGNARPSLTNARRPLSRSTDAVACAVARVPTEDIISSAYASMRRESSRGSRRSASPGGLHLETQGSKSNMSTETDTKLTALGERFEKLLLEHMDAWLEWAPRMRAALAKVRDNTAALAVAIQRNGCDVAQARMSELERDM